MPPLPNTGNRPAAYTHGRFAMASADAELARDGAALLSQVKFMRDGMEKALGRRPALILLVVDGDQRAAAEQILKVALDPPALAERPAAYTPDGAPTTGWIGVDFDGTLAEYHGWTPELGKPVPSMLARVKAWRAQGVSVRIVTARVSTDGEQLVAQVDLIQNWCLEHLGEVLPITCSKDLAMVELWDDRAVTVEANTGRVICHAAGEWTP